VRRVPARQAGVVGVRREAPRFGASLVCTV
jgi:hypothetical protein